MNTINFSFPKLIASLIGIIWYSIEPTLNYELLCIFAVLIDVISAVRCNRRIRKIAPHATDGKVKSQHISKIITDLCIVWLCMLLADGVEKQLLLHLGSLHLAQYIAAIFIAITALSIAENESTAKDAKWAKLLQKVIASKISRHTDVPEQEILDMLNEDKK